MGGKCPGPLWTVSWAWSSQAAPGGGMTQSRLPPTRFRADSLSHPRLRGETEAVCFLNKRCFLGCKASWHRWPCTRSNLIKPVGEAPTAAHFSLGSRPPLQLAEGPGDQQGPFTPAKREAPACHRPPPARGAGPVSPLPQARPTLLSSECLPCVLGTSTPTAKRGTRADSGEPPRRGK